MLAVGLSPALTSSLRELAVHLPSLKREIADGLLKIPSLSLIQQPFRHSTTLSGLKPPDSQSVVIGLKTIGGFNFEGHSLLQFGSFHFEGHSLLQFVRTACRGPQA